MPLVPSSTIQPDIYIPQERKPTAVPYAYEPEPTFMESLGADFRLNTSIGSFLSNAEKNDNNFDPNFDWRKAYDSLPEDIKINYGDAFAESENEQHFNSIREQIELKEEDRKLLAETGWAGVAAQFGSQLFLEPLNLVPFGAAAKYGVKAKSILTGAAQVATAGAAASTAQESIIHSQDLTRTFGESAANVAGATLLSGVLGGAFYKTLAKTDPLKIEALKKDAEKSLDLPEEYTDTIKETGSVPEPKSLSSAGNKPLDTSLDEETIQSAAFIEKTLGFQDPGLRILQSKSVEARRAFQELAEIPFKLKKNWQGLPTATAAESEIGLLHGRSALAIDKTNEAWKAYKARMTGPLAKDRLSRSAFNEEIADAISRGVKSDIPEVIDAASYIDKEIYKYIAERGKKVKGFFKGEDLEVVTATNYVNRMYKVGTAIKEAPRFIATAVEWLKKEAATSKSPAKKAALEDVAEFGDETFFVREAQNMHRNVIGARSSDLHDGLEFSGQAKFLKSRKWTIKDEVIRDFLERDINVLVKSYIRSMGSRLVIAEKFGVDFLDDSFKDAKSATIKAIKEEFKIKQAKVIDDPKKLDKLLKEEEKTINDLLAVRDRLLGSYGMSSNPSSWLYRTQKVAKQLNVLRLLGSAGFAAIADIGKLIGVRGGMYAFKDGLVPLIKMVGSPEMRAHFKKYTKEMKRFNIGTELILNERNGAINDIIDDFGRTTKFERGLDALSQNFSKVNLVSYWNNALKTMASMVIQSNVYDSLEIVAKGGKLKPKELAKLNELGISENLAGIIYKQIEKHGEKIDSLIVPNIANWDDEFKEVGDIYASAILKETNKTIVTPGVATTPLWLSRGGFNLIGQFKSFAFSSVQKTLIPMAQDADAKTAQAVIAMIGLGVISSMLKRINSNQEIPEDPKVLIMEGVDRSGLTGWLFDVNNMVENVSSRRLGLSRVFGTQPLNRYADRAKLEAVLGPTAKMAVDLGTIASDIGSLDYKQRTTHAIRQMMPYQNLYGLRLGIDKMEEVFNNALGIPK